MKLIGHRGAAGLAPENTIKAIKAGIAAGADAIEIDVRLTPQRSFVLSHSSSYDPISSATLEQAVKAVGSIPLMVEIKDADSANSLAETIKTSSKPESQWIVTSFLYEELKQLKQLLPGISFFMASYRHPLKVLRAARNLGADGIVLNAWLLNPLTYWLAKKRGLKIMVYANFYSFIVNSPRAVKILIGFYPNIAICTDRPDKIRPVLKP